MKAKKAVSWMDFESSVTEAAAQHRIVYLKKKTPGGHSNKHIKVLQITPGQ